MIDFLVNLASNLRPKTFQKSTQEASNIDKNGIQDMMQVGLEFGALLDRFLVDFGAKLGGKLGPSWHQHPEKRGPKTMLKKCPKIVSKKVTQATRATQVHAVAGGVGPYNQPIQSFQEPTCALDTPLGH